MEAPQLPSEEEIKAAYDQGKEAVVALFYATFQKLAKRISSWKIGWRRTAATAENHLPAWTGQETQEFTA